MTLCPKCKKYELSEDGICDLCSLVGEIFEHCGPVAVRDVRTQLERVKEDRKKEADE